MIELQVIELDNILGRYLALTSPLKLLILGYTSVYEVYYCRYDFLLVIL